MKLCTECLGEGRVKSFEETSRTEETVTVMMTDTVCPVCHGRGEVCETNADRIRAMSDEELGRFLATVENRRSAAGGGAIWKGAAHAIEWLKQPAEEVDDG